MCYESMQIVWFKFSFGLRDLVYTGCRATKVYTVYRKIEGDWRRKRAFSSASVAVYWIEHWIDGRWTWCVYLENAITLIRIEFRIGSESSTFEPVFGKQFVGSNQIWLAILLLLSNTPLKCDCHKPWNVITGFPSSFRSNLLVSRDSWSILFSSLLTR